MKGLKLRKIVGLFALVLIAAGVMVAHVWKQNAFIRISREAVKLGQSEAHLRNEIALLELEIGELRRFSRIEALAKGRFGLEYAKAPVLVYSEAAGAGAGGADARSPATRAQSAAASQAPKAPGLEAGKVAWRTSAL